MDDAEKQAAQDMLTLLQNQRNAAQNECVQLAAQIQALRREMEAKDKRIQELEAKSADNADNDTPSLPLSIPKSARNGLHPE